MIDAVLSAHSQYVDVHYVTGVHATLIYSQVYQDSVDPVDGNSGTIADW